MFVFRLQLKPLKAGHRRVTTAFETYSNFEQMASSTPVSPEELKAAAEVIARYQSSGVAIVEGPKTGGAKSGSTGAMHDGSKRLRSLDEDWEAVEAMEAATSYQIPDSTLVKDRMEKKPQEQLPLHPMSAGKKCALPPGISTLGEWGKTLCTLPKHAASKLSYQELVADDSKHEYLVWVVKHGKGRGGRFEDLALYLEAIGFESSSSHSSKPEETFLGSSARRVLKS